MIELRQRAPKSHTLSQNTTYVLACRAKLNILLPDQPSIREDFALRLIPSSVIARVNNDAC